MRSSTSSSDLRFLAAFALTVLVLTASWEALLRKRAVQPRDFAIARPQLVDDGAARERWVVVGNCLMMTGISPRRLNESLGEDPRRTIVNIAAHEQSPHAFFDYLLGADETPRVVIANVSSWINGTNFEQESALVRKDDPLHIAPGARVPKKASPEQQSFRNDEGRATATFQSRAEDTLARAAAANVHAFGRRHHLFDYSLFLGKLVTSGDVDESLYQLNIQSWFKVTKNETDGYGYVGLQVQYREDWARGVEVMAERSLQRLRLSRLLTPTYWSLLEERIAQLVSRGTSVYIVRMPEHPKIREFNDATYELPQKLRQIEERTGARVLDLSRLGTDESVRLFDAVHPDADAAAVITRELATWLRANSPVVRSVPSTRRAGGG